jgi:phosphoglycolate phosphatase-like HAD superfamily hydrolase
MGRSSRASRSTWRACKRCAATTGSTSPDLPDDRFCGVHMFDVWTALPPAAATVSLPRPLVGRHRRRLRRALRLMEDVREVVARLVGLGFRQMCVSNSSRRIVDANIAALGIGRCSNSPSASTTSPRGSPSRCRIERPARSWAPPGDVVAVEDSATGARSTRRAGLFVLGFSPRRLPFGDADTITSSLRDIPAMLADGSDRLP